MTQHLDVRPCPGCGEGVLPKATYCSHCGTRLRGVTRQPPSGAAVVAAVLLVLVALPLGLVGSGCTVMLLGAGQSPEILPFALIGIVLLTVAVCCCLAAGKLLSGR